MMCKRSGQLASARNEPPGGLHESAANNRALQPNQPRRSTIQPTLTFSKQIGQTGQKGGTVASIVAVLLIACRLSLASTTPRDRNGRLIDGQIKLSNGNDLVLLLSKIKSCKINFLQVPGDESGRLIWVCMREQLYDSVHELLLLTNWAQVSFYQNWGTSIPIHAHRQLYSMKTQANIRQAPTQLPGH